MRQVVSIQEQPRLQCSRLGWLVIDAVAIGWVIYVGLKIFGV